MPTVDEGDENVPNINGKYPYKANWVILEKKDKFVIARNGLTDEDIRLSMREAEYLNSLNGDRDAFKIEGFSERECQRYYHYLDNSFLLRTGRSLKYGGSKMYTLLIPHKKRSHSIVFKVLNAILFLMFLPIFLYGLHRLAVYGVVLPDVGYGHLMLDILLGVLVFGLALGLSAHEGGHTIACLAADGSFFELGLVLRNGVMPGAYVLLDDSMVKNRLKRAQINLAGIEANLLLVGLGLIILTSVAENSSLYEWKMVIYYGVVINICVAIININFAEGLDGAQVLSALLGTDELIVTGAKENVRKMFNRRDRKLYFEKHGVAGAADIIISIVILGYQMMIPLFILADISVCIGVFLL